MTESSASDSTPAHARVGNDGTAVYRLPVCVDGSRHRFHCDAHGWKATVSRTNDGGSATIICTRGPSESRDEGARAFVQHIDRAWDEQFSADGRALAVLWYQWRHGRPGIRAGATSMRDAFQRRLVTLSTWSHERAFLRRDMVAAVEALVGFPLDLPQPSWVMAALADHDLATWSERFVQGLEATHHALA